MLQRGSSICRNSAYHLLQECTRRKDHESGRHVQLLMVQNGLDSVTVLGDYLIRLFSSCGSLFEVNQTFIKVLHPNVYTWSSVILAHAEIGQCENAIELYTRMQVSGVTSDRYSYLAIVKACTVTCDLTLGRNVHLQIIESHQELDNILGNTLVHMYAKCGSIEEACLLFEMLPHRDIVSWSAIIAGCVHHDNSLLALDYVRMMQDKGINPDKFMYSSILKACASIRSLGEGRLIHNQILKDGFEWDIILGSTLMDMYAKCGSFNEAHKVSCKLPRQDVISWGTIINGYAEQGKGSLALECYKTMQADEITPDKMTISSVLRACGSIGAIAQGRNIHDQICKYGITWDGIVGNTLVDMYIKCGSLEESCIVFNKIQNRDVVTWNALIAGYTQNAEGGLAIDCFENMQREGIKANRITFLSTLKSCGSMGTIQQGRIIHDEILVQGLECDVEIGNTLVDMYAKCGSLEEALQTFYSLPNRDVVTWSVLIAGYSQHGEACLVIEFFQKMYMENIRPNRVTFLSVLAAFSHAGLLNKGYWYFGHMKEHEMVPDMDHYTCMIDLLGRAGCVDEAEDLLRTSGQENASAWRSLLSACEIYGNLELGRHCFVEISNLGCTL